MSGKDVAEIREKLDSELNRIANLVKSLKFQEADEGITIVEELFEQLEKAVDPSNEIQKTIIWNRRSKMEALCQRIEDGLQRREAGKKEDGNIAFKCNWNDRGYKGICSETAYIYNIRRQSPWCIWSRCRNFDRAQDVPEDICYESRALLDCSFGAGWDHDDKGIGIRPRKIWAARKDKFAILTTEPPNRRERLVVAAFQITGLVEDPGKETIIFGDKSMCLDDMLSYEIKFWDYHKNPRNTKSKAWAQGLFRYVSDVAVLGILEEYISKKGANKGDTSRAIELSLRLKQKVSE